MNELGRVQRFALFVFLVVFTFALGFGALSSDSPQLSVFFWIPLAAYVFALCARLLGTDMQLADGFVVSLVAIIAVVFALTPVLQRGPDDPFPDPCKKRLHEIASALSAYQEARKRYPPPYIADAEGRPLVSWRVVLLPYLGEHTLYEKWKQHRDEPWDGQHNRKNSQQEIGVFHCPSDKGPNTDASYVAVVGPGTIWPDGSKRVTNDSIRDGTDNTLLIVEVKNSGINWMEPRDLDFETLSLGVNPGSGLGVSSNHPGYVNAVFASGRIVTIHENIALDQLRALFTIGGREKLEPLP